MSNARELGEMCFPRQPAGTRPDIAKLDALFPLKLPTRPLGSSSRSWRQEVILAGAGPIVLAQMLEDAHDVRAERAQNDGTDAVKAERDWKCGILYAGVGSGEGRDADGSVRCIRRS
jgi:hypothetical protein